MAVPSQSPESTRSFDVIILGAGIAGLNSAYRLISELPGATFTVLEGRDNVGGTWDLFRYPGVRSDSDLFTYGFAWRLVSRILYPSWASRLTGYETEIRSSC